MASLMVLLIISLVSRDGFISLIYNTDRGYGSCFFSIPNVILSNNKVEAVLIMVTLRSGDLGILIPVEEVLLVWHCFDVYWISSPRPFLMNYTRNQEAITSLINAIISVFSPPQ
jgi:hypothetical protein